MRFRAPCLRSDPVTVEVLPAPRALGAAGEPARGDPAAAPGRKGRAGEVVVRRADSHDRALLSGRAAALDPEYRAPDGPDSGPSPGGAALVVHDRRQRPLAGERDAHDSLSHGGGPAARRRRAHAVRAGGRRGRRRFARAPGWRRARADGRDRERSSGGRGGGGARGRAALRLSRRGRRLRATRWRPSARAVRADETLNLTVRLTGHGGLRLAPLPEWPALDDFQIYSKGSEDSLEVSRATSRWGEGRPLLAVSPPAGDARVARAAYVTYIPGEGYRVLGSESAVGARRSAARRDDGLALVPPTARGASRSPPPAAPVAGLARRAARRRDRAVSARLARSCRASKRARAESLVAQARSGLSKARSGTDATFTSPRPSGARGRGAAAVRETARAEEENAARQARRSSARGRRVTRPEARRPMSRASPAARSPSRDRWRGPEPRKGRRRFPRGCSPPGCCWSRVASGSEPGASTGIARRAGGRGVARGSQEDRGTANRARPRACSTPCGGVACAAVRWRRRPLWPRSGNAGSASVPYGSSADAGRPPRSLRALGAPRSARRRGRPAGASRRPGHGGHAAARSRVGACGSWPRRSCSSYVLLRGDPRRRTARVLVSPPGRRGARGPDVVWCLAERLGPRRRDHRSGAVARLAQRTRAARSRARPPGLTRGSRDEWERVGSAAVTGWIPVSRDRVRLKPSGREGC